MKLNTTSLHLCSLFFFFITTCFWLSSKIINEKISIVNDCLVHLVIISILQDFTCVDQLIHGMVSCFQLQLFHRFAYTWNVREDGAYFYYPCLLAFDSVPKFRDLTELFRRNFRDFSFRRNLTKTKLFLPRRINVFRFCLESTYLIPGIEVSDRYDVLCDDRKEDRSLRL